jgi:hypothetical protein
MQKERERTATATPRRGGLTVALGHAQEAARGLVHRLCDAPMPSAARVQKPRVMPTNGSEVLCALGIACEIARRRGGLKGPMSRHGVMGPQGVSGEREVCVGGDGC